MLSGISRISFSTVPQFSKRAISDFFSLFCSAVAGRVIPAKAITSAITRSITVHLVLSGKTTRHHRVPRNPVQRSYSNYVSDRLVEGAKNARVLSSILFRDARQR